MNSSEIRNKFLEHLARQCPDLRTVEIRERNLDAILQIVAVATSIGAFSALWKALEIWHSKRNKSSVKVSYESSNGSNVEIEYRNMTVSEIENVIKRNPPMLKEPVKVIFIRDLDHEETQTILD